MVTEQTTLHFENVMHEVPVLFVIIVCAEKNIIVLKY